MIFCALTGVSAAAQSPESRITRPVVDFQRVILSGHIHPLAQAKYDQGAVDDSAPASRVLLLLSRTEAQQKALDQLLEEQQTQGSANYHRWLTAEEFGAQFGASESDVQKITAWLTSKGFTVEKVAANKMLIEVSGTAGQVRSAFSTELHNYALPGGTFTANNADPQIPAALAPVVSGFVSLNSFPRRSFMHVLGTVVHSSTGTIQPQWTTSGGSYAIGPGDFATIYNSFPLLRNSIDGSGQTIGVVGRSEINTSDVANFRSFFGLSSGDYSIIVDGTDPGYVSGDESESALDVEWAGATAPGAKVRLVIAKSTSTTDGVDLAAEYIVDNNMADILSESYGSCEANLGTSGNSFYKNLWQQAASQGITVVISSGDSGSAGCENPSIAPVSESLLGGLAVNGIASTPYNVAVGGTDFNDAASTSTYWGSNYTDSATGLKHISALSYIPEMTWNDSCAHSASASSLTTCANVTSIDQSMYGTLQLWAGSGGPSNCAVSSTSGNTTTCSSGYSKPSWQTGTGVPNDGVRDIPDVSFFASVGKSGSNSFYVVCQEDQGASCVPDSKGNISYSAVGGTSAAAPNFAAVVALVGQQVGNQRLGNINYYLYKIAAQSDASCASSGSASSSCTFYDTQVGNISVPCMAGSPDCSLTSGKGTGILVANKKPAYMTGSGYDTATGLGSMNINNLASAISGMAVPTLSTPTATSTALNLGDSTTLSVTVTGNSTIGVPTGTITFYNGSTSIGDATTSGNSSAYTLSGTLTYTPSNTGTESITAKFTSSGEYLDATSSALSIDVVTSATISTPTASPSSFTIGKSTSLSVTVTGSSTSGVPTGTITFYDGSTSIGTATTSSDSSNYNLTGTLSYTPSTSGTHSIKAQYGGDDNYSSKTSSSVTVTANATFTQSLSSSAITVSSSGGSGTNAVTFTPASTGIPSGTTVAYYCTSSSTAASCSPTSSSTGSTSLSDSSVTVNVTYTVPAPSASTSAAQHNNISRLGSGLVFAGVLLFSVPGVRRRRHLLAMLLLITFVGIAAGCGGNGSSSKSARAETFTFTVTSTATAYGATTTQTSTFTVTN
jgi:subtilase family serine protease